MYPVTKRTAEYTINQTLLRVTYGDITQIDAEALVSSDDNCLTMGGGVSYSILVNAGYSIQEEARKHIPLKVGDVAVTSAGNLPAKYIFHAVTIDNSNFIFPSEQNIKNMVRRCLELADILGVKKIAFPALGTGAGGFPFQLAADVMTRVITDYLIGNTQIELITITLFPREFTKENDLNIFYERAVALASISTQSRQLGVSLNNLEEAVKEMELPILSKKLGKLQSDLTIAQKILEEKPENLEQLEEIQKRSRITNLSKQIAEVANESEMILWENKKLEEKSLQTRLNGLLIQLNIKYCHLNNFEIEKAKYGAIGVPSKLKTVIEELKKDINGIEIQINKNKEKLVSLSVERDNFDSYS